MDTVHIEYLFIFLVPYYYNTILMNRVQDFG